MIHTRVLGTSSRDIATPLLAAVNGERAGHVRMCSWCNRIVVDDVWLEPETAIARLKLFLHREVPAVTHGICPACRARVEGGVSVAEVA